MNKKGREQPDFMPEVEKLQEQILALKDRISLVEQNKDKVRPKIYEKVRNDYAEKLDELNSLLSPYQEKIENLIKEIESAMEDLQVEIETYTEDLEELELRFLANEFPEDEFDPKQTELDGLKSEVQAKLDEHQDTVNRYKEQLAFITGEPIESPAVEPEIQPEQIMEESPETTPEYEEPLALVDQASDSPAADLVFDDRFVSEMPPEQIEEIEESDEEAIEPTLESSPQITDSELKSDTHVGEMPPEAMPVEKMAAGEEDDYIWENKPVLDVIEGDFAGESYPMDKERITIGRGPNNDIQLATDTSVSRHHAQISFENNRYVVVDLESSNGTSVNGIRITRSYLRPNDEIMIGTSKLVIRPV